MCDRHGDWLSRCRFRARDSVGSPAAGPCCRDRGTRTSPSDENDSRINLGPSDTLCGRLVRAARRDARWRRFDARRVRSTALLEVADVHQQPSDRWRRNGSSRVLHRGVARQPHCRDRGGDDGRRSYWRRPLGLLRSDCCAGAWTQLFRSCPETRTDRRFIGADVCAARDSARHCVRGPFASHPAAVCCPCACC